jgi:hypothetical protein
MNDNHDTPVESATPNEASQQVAIVFIGALEDCKQIMAFLTEQGIIAQLNVAELIRPELQSRGYYIVMTVPSDGERARQLIERKFQADFDLDAVEESDVDTCPACGTALPHGCAACPECGLVFT